MSKGAVISLRPTWIFYNGLLFAFAIGWIPRLLFNADVSGALDALLVVISILVLSVRRLTRRHSLYLLSIVIYVFIGMIAAVLFRGANILDFLVAYKFLWYLAILIPLAGRQLLNQIQMRRLLRIALVMFALVYVAKSLLGSGRPIFFTENNFEILLLCLMLVGNHVANGRTSLVDVMLLLAIALLSGSRSGAVLVAVVVLYSFDFRRLRSASSILILSAGAVGIMLAGYVFLTRTSGGVESIDRYMFFMGLLESVHGWSWFDFLTGASRISPLPVQVCSRLSFYDALFSYSGNGSCYSVVLHSFLMRIVYDHGLIISFLTGCMIWRLMVGLPTKAKLCVLGLLVFNGMSVSSINSIYAALGLAFLFSACRNTGALRVAEGELR